MLFAPPGKVQILAPPTNCCCHEAPGWPGTAPRECRLGDPVTVRGTRRLGRKLGQRYSAAIAARTERGSIVLGSMPTSFSAAVSEASARVGRPLGRFVGGV